MKSPYGFIESSVRLAMRVHRDQRGTISIVSIFTLILLVMLLGMVINSTRQVNRKVQMQNAADAATFSGGVVMTRGMNTLAFTNHLLAEVFALTAFMREAGNRDAESFTPETLEHWTRIAPHLASSEFPRFANLGAMIPGKVQAEAEAILAYNNLHQTISSEMLPVLEEILALELIPQFQRALIENTPRIAQAATNEVAQRHGRAWPDRGELYGVLWHTTGEPVGSFDEVSQRTLPVVDPVLDALPNQMGYMEQAREHRRDMANAYLQRWDREKLNSFDNYAKMSRFSSIWRIFTNGHLDHLLEVEYPNRNLPMQIREVPGQYGDRNTTLEEDYMYVGVVYEQGIEEHMPGVFNSPVEFDQQAYAQMFMFVPTRRLHRSGDILRQDWNYWIDSRGMVHWYNAGPTGQRGMNWRSPNHPSDWGQHPNEWGLISQNWTNQLTPATTPSLLEILSTQPTVLNGVNIDVPRFENVSAEELIWLSHH